MASILAVVWLTTSLRGKLNENEVGLNHILQAVNKSSHGHRIISLKVTEKKIEIVAERNDGKMKFYTFTQNGSEIEFESAKETPQSG